MTLSEGTPRAIAPRAVLMAVAAGVGVDPLRLRKLYAMQSSVCNRFHSQKGLLGRLRRGPTCHRCAAPLAHFWGARRVKIMTASFRLSLPTDIPWRRICVSRDMVDPLSCDDERPPRFSSSLAAFRYEPAEEYQPYEEEVVTYVKVVATIAPFSPDVSV